MKYLFLIYFILNTIFTFELKAQSFYAGENYLDDEINKDSPIKWFKNIGSSLYKNYEINQHFNHLIQSEFFEINDWWGNDFSSINFCPNEKFAKNLNYSRYLFRILTLSYITEFLKDASFITNNSNCSFEFNDIFKNCNPESNDMKNYLYRLRLSYDNFLKASPRYFSNQFTKVFCHNEKKGNCNFSQICSEVKVIAKNICNEKDYVYGQSSNVNLLRILEKSSALGAVESISMMKSCLGRFVAYYKNREVQNSNLSKLYKYVFYKLTKSDSRYLEGLNFVPGSLKEFDLKGLTGFLLKLPKPVVKIANVSKLKRKIKRRRLLKKSVNRKKIQPKATIKIIEKKTKKVIKRSAFEFARYKLKKYKLYKSRVNLTRFKKEYFLTRSKIKRFDLKLKKFVSRKVLTEMKSFEKLGSRKAPLPLILIDYLLVTNNHQGLWNIVSILGNEFYVFNNIENTPGNVSIRLENSLKTKYKWHLNIIRSK